MCIRIKGCNRSAGTARIGERSSRWKDGAAARSRRPASEVRISPDGKHALAKLNEQLFLIAMPAAGGETPTINVNSPSVPVKKLTDIGADDFQWADDGKTMTWALGSSFFRQALATVTYDPPKSGERGRRKPDAKKTRKPSRKRNRWRRKSRSGSSSLAGRRPERSFCAARKSSP